MKIKIRDIKGNKKVNRVEYINSALIIDNRVYKKRRNKEIYNYLEAKDFRYYLEPIRTKRLELEQDLDYVYQVLEEGTKKAQKVAKENMKKFKQAMKIDYFD